MRIFFEQHPYEASYVKDDLKDICALQDVEKKISVGYVGYFYSPEAKDCVFILPKVLLEDRKDEGGKPIEVVANIMTTDDDGNQRHVLPEEIITPEGQEKNLTKEYRKFIYEFAVWIYQALSVYRKNTGSNAVYYRKLPQEGNGRRRMGETYLDIVLSLIAFNKENQNFFTFIIRNLHSGMNKINWTKTIARSSAIIQDGSVVYLTPINKKRQVNFEEELFIIFFSILNYLNETFGFRTPINCHYDLIRGEQFKHLMESGRGMRWLKQIKYKYFSDKLLRMWNLCLAFFEESHRIAINTDQKEYLLAKSFEQVFEAMIDELIGDRENVPKRLMEQADGKRVDHMYAYQALTTPDNEQTDKLIYYIGDSKYYKAHHKLGEESIYKQYTYARNVIQWNIDLFMDGQRKGWTKEEIDDYNERFNEYGKIRLRNDDEDPLTEGYNVIPNFFISAFVYDDRKYVARKNIRPHEGENTHFSCQFPDRLFDRDTLILSHYDVNFLYVLYLYARDKQSEKEAWRKKVRDIFRDEIRNVLHKKYQFFALKSKGNLLAGEEFIREHFKELQGKLYRPYDDNSLFALALDKHEGKEATESDTYHLLEEFFEITKVDLGYNPQEELEKKVEAYQAEHPYAPTPENWLPEYHVERYLEDYFVVGSYHDQEHWDWITGKNDRGTLIYNVRLDEHRKGAIHKSRIRAMKPRFAILYEEGHEAENRYHVFRIHDFAIMIEDRMRQALYPREPQGDYFIFRFDEEVALGRFDIHNLISTHRISDKDFTEGAPIFLTGKELMDFRK